MLDLRVLRRTYAHRQELQAHDPFALGVDSLYCAILIIDGITSQGNTPESIDEVPVLRRGEYYAVYRYF